MSKLEDIPKKSIFKVPEGYFEQLPTTLQARMAREHQHTPARSIVWFSLKFVLPVVALIVAGIFWFRPNAPVFDELEEIDTEQIALYLANTDRVDTEVDHETIDWTSTELDALKDSVYSNMEYSENDLDNILEDIDLDNL